MELVAEKYDYGQFTKPVQKELKQAAEFCRAAPRETVFAVGRMLAEKRARFAESDEDGFCRWVELECDIRRPRAYEMIRIVEVFPDSGILMSKQALVDLSAPSCPPAARAEATDRAESGENITYSIASEVIRRHKQKALPPVEHDDGPPSVQAEDVDAYACTDSVHERRNEPNQQDEPIQGELLPADHVGDDEWETDEELSHSEPEYEGGWLVHAEQAVLLARSDNNIIAMLKHMLGILDDAERIMVDAVLGSPAEEELTDSKYSVAFDSFWDAWPKQRKRSKGDAWKAWEKAIKKADARLILAKAQEFAASSEGKSQYCPGPAPWLNQERWDDDPEAWERDEGGTKTDGVASYLES